MSRIITTTVYTLHELSSTAVTAAADIQRAVLIHYSVITCDFGTCRALTINGGVTVIVHGGFITVNLRAGAAVTDGIVAVVVDDGFVAVDQNTCSRWLHHR